MCFILPLASRVQTEGELSYSLPRVCKGVSRVQVWFEYALIILLFLNVLSVAVTDFCLFL